MQTSKVFVILALFVSLTRAFPAVNLQDDESLTRKTRGIGLDIGFGGFDDYGYGGYGYGGYGPSYIGYPGYWDNLYGGIYAGIGGGLSIGYGTPNYYGWNNHHHHHRY